MFYLAQIEFEYPVHCNVEKKLKKNWLGQNSAWMYIYHFYDLKVHFGWPNKCFIWLRLSLNTLYCDLTFIQCDVIKINLYKCQINKVDIWVQSENVVKISSAHYGCHVFLKLHFNIEINLHEFSWLSNK